MFTFQLRITYQNLYTQNKRSRINTMSLIADNSLFRVLIVDDLDDNRMLLRLDLEDELPGIYIDEANNGLNALKMLENNNYTPTSNDVVKIYNSNSPIERRIINEFNEYQTQNSEKLIALGFLNEPLMGINNEKTREWALQCLESSFAS